MFVLNTHVRDRERLVTKRSIINKTREDESIASCVAQWLDGRSREERVYQGLEFESRYGHRWKKKEKKTEKNARPRFEDLIVTRDMVTRGFDGGSLKRRLGGRKEILGILFNFSPAKKKKKNQFLNAPEKTKNNWAEKKKKIGLRKILSRTVKSNFSLSLYDFV